MKKGFFQIGLIVLVASFAVAGLLINKLRFDNSNASTGACVNGCCYDNNTGAGFCSGNNNEYLCYKAVAEKGYPKDANPCKTGYRQVGSICLSYESCTWTGSNAPAGTWCPANTNPKCTVKPTNPPQPSPVITPTPQPSPTAPAGTATPTIKPTASPTVKPTVKPTSTPISGVCKITFVPADHKAVCWKDAQDFSVNYKVESLPTNGVYYMQTDWYVASPTVGSNHYNESQRIYAGQTYSFTAHWPGVSGNPSNVDVQLGLNVVDANHNLISPNCSMGLDYYWTPYVCKFTPIPQPSPTAPAGTATPTVKPTSTPKPTATPTVTVKPTFSPTPSATPVAKSYLKICKFKDENGNGYKDSEDKAISWNFNYEYDDAIHSAENHWWNIFDKGCVKVEVPNGKSVTVSEEGKSGWELTGIYADSSKTSGGNYIYNSESGKTKEVWFLNKLNPQSTPTVGEPNSCNGTCGSNSNCQSGLYCYQGYCRNPNNPQSTSCNNPEVLGATSAPVTVLPKTGNNIYLNLFGMATLAGTGFYLYKKFNLV